LGYARNETQSKIIEIRDFKYQKINDSNGDNDTDSNNDENDDDYMIIRTMMMMMMII
jgi:hypothetical protein